MSKTVKYEFDNTVINTVDVELEEALGAINWSRGKPVLVEFPEGVWKNPVKTGVGHREQNPDWPKHHSQRYQWVGSPHELRIPRDADDQLIVHYMSGIYSLHGGQRFYANGKKELFVYAVKIGDRAPPNRDYYAETRSPRTSDK